MKPSFDYIYIASKTYRYASITFKLWQIFLCLAEKLICLRSKPQLHIVLRVSLDAQLHVLLGAASLQ